MNAWQITVRPDAWATIRYVGWGARLGGAAISNKPNGGAWQAVSSLHNLYRPLSRQSRWGAGPSKKTPFAGFVKVVITWDQGSHTAISSRKYISCIPETHRDWLLLMAMFDPKLTASGVPDLPGVRVRLRAKRSGGSQSLPRYYNPSVDDVGRWWQDGLQPLVSLTLRPGKRLPAYPSAPVPKGVQSMQCGGGPIDGEPGGPVGPLPRQVLAIRRPHRPIRLPPREVMEAQPRRGVRQIVGGVQEWRGG